jgi:ATP-dependent DNA helicase PIF1
MSDIYSIFGSVQKKNVKYGGHKRRKPTDDNEREWKHAGFDKLTKRIKIRGKRGVPAPAEVIAEKAKGPTSSFTFDRTKYYSVLTAGSHRVSSASGTWKWSVDQQRVISLVRQGHNVFFSGGGGCGKSALMRYLIQLMRGEGRTIAVAAPTGLAAFAIEGTTLHALIGLPGRDYLRDIDYRVNRMIKSKSIRERWTTMDTLFIDEFSMVDYDMFGNLDYMARKIREINQPFGGIQVIGCGDFFQLPPVRTQNQQNNPDDPLFAFQHPRWLTTFPRNHSVLLRSSFRQSDSTFASMLNELREGIVSPRTQTMLQSVTQRYQQASVTVNPSSVASVPCSLCLFSRRADVDRANEMEFERASHKQSVSSFTVRWQFIEQDIAEMWRLRRQELIKRRAPAEQIRRAHHEWMLRPDKDWQHEQMEKEAMWVPVLPLCVGARVMLTVNLDPAGGLMNGACGTIVRWAGTETNDENAPVVQFDSGAVVVVRRYPWYRECKQGTLIAWQLPLKHAWAITIHKAQGLTLDRAEVDLSRVFEKGQAYVAVSRVRTLDGLRFSSYQPDAFDVDPRVREFYDSIDPLLLAWSALEPAGILRPLFELITEYGEGR